MEWIADLVGSAVGGALLYVALVAIALVLLYRLLQPALRRVAKAVADLRAQIRSFSARVRRLPGLARQRLYRLARFLLSRPARIVSAAKNALRTAFFGVRIYDNHKRKPEVLSRASIATAIAAATERRAFINSQLYRTEWRREIVQVPPHLADRPHTTGVEKLSEADAAVQDVVLRWEQGLGEPIIAANNVHAAAPLLLGKAFDAVISILRVEGHLSPPPERRFLDDTHVDLTLQHVAMTSSNSTAFPWVIVIGTNNREIFRTHVPRLATWLGVAVQLAEPSRMVQQRAASRRLRRQGLIAGVLRDANGSEAARRDFAITCAHVLTDDSPGVVFRGDWKNTSQPDAALLELSDTLRLSSTPFIVNPLRLDFGRMQADEHERNREFVVAGRKRRVKRARIVGLVMGYRLDGRLGSFPAWEVCSVRALARKLFFWVVPWPLFGLKFSRKGDSGAWIVRAESHDEWLGLLVGAKGEDRRTSVILCGDLLIDYFGRSLGERVGRTDLAFSPMLLARSQMLWLRPSTNSTPGLAWRASVSRLVPL